MITMKLLTDMGDFVLCGIDLVGLNTRRSLSGFHQSHSLFVSRARIIDGSRLQRPLAAM